MTRLQTLVSTSYLYGAPEPLRAVREILRRYSFRDVLMIISRLNFLIGYGELTNSRGDFNPEPFLSDFLLRPAHQDRIAARSGAAASPRIVFSRQQMLLLLRLAALACKEPGRLSFSEDEGRYSFGDACLIANDHLVTAKQAQAINRGSLSKRTRHLALQLAFLTEFYNPLIPRRGIARSERMFGETVASACMQERSTAIHFDAVSRFESATDLSFEDYRDVLLAVLIQYLSVSPAAAIAQPGLLTIRRASYLASSQLPQRVFERFLALESRPLSNLRAGLREKRPAAAALDAMDLRIRPLVELDDGLLICPDPAFLAEKLGYGMRWSLVNGMRGRRESGQTLEWFGHLFECYTASLFEELFPAATGRFTARPRFPGGEEACDGVIRYPDQWLWYEAKGGGLDELAKYGGTWQPFYESIEDRLGDRPGGAIGQLANGLERAFHEDRNRRAPVDGQEARVGTVSPVLIVHEPFLRGPLVGWLLNKMFVRAIRRRRVTPGVTVKPLIVLDITTLEILKDAIEGGGVTLQQAVNALTARDPERLASNHDALFDLFPGVYGTDSAGSVVSRIDRVFERAGRKVFGPAWDLRRVGSGAADS